MTRFSLKRTLQFDLAFSAAVIHRMYQDVATSNLYTPLRSSTVLLSIGKITNLCHQKIPLKKIDRNKTIIYGSAIALKLAKNWQRPADEIASVLISVLQTHRSQPVWSMLRQTPQGWLEFEIAQQGIQKWQQYFERAMLPTVQSGSRLALEPDTLWQLQAGYELCCRWQACYQQLCPVSGSLTPVPDETAPFLIPFAPLENIIHCLLDICDLWDDTRNSHMLFQANRLVSALEDCTRTIRFAAPEAKIVAVWFGLAQAVLKQLLRERLNCPVASEL